MNPATRVFATYCKLVQYQPGNKKMVYGWGFAFGIDVPDDNAEDKVIAALQLFIAELDLARSQLLAAGVPEDLLHPGFQRLRDFASPAVIRSDWSSQIGNVNSPEVRKCLEWAAFELSKHDTEDEVAPAELAALTQELADLEAALSGVDAKVSPHLRAFVQRQIDSIRAALSTYTLQGIARRCPTDSCNRRRSGTRYAANLASST